MIRVFLVVVLTVVMFTGHGNAIQRVTRTHNIGIKAGFALAEHYGCDKAEEERKLGFTGGIFAEFPLSPGWSIQPELLFSMRGWKFVDNADLNYLELPILVKHRFSDAGRAVPSLFAGPVVAMLLSADHPWDNDFEDAIKDFDLAVAFGVGW